MINLGCESKTKTINKVTWFRFSFQRLRSADRQIRIHENNPNNRGDFARGFFSKSEWKNMYHLPQHRKCDAWKRVLLLVGWPRRSSATLPHNSSWFFKRRRRRYQWKNQPVNHSSWNKWRGPFDGSTNAGISSIFNDNSGFALYPGGDLRFSGFDLELGGLPGTPMEIGISGTWTLLTDNDINPYAGLPATISVDMLGVFRKSGGSGLSKINIPFLTYFGGSVDVEQGTLAFCGEWCAFLEQTLITGNGRVVVAATNSIFAVTTVAPGATLELAGGIFTGDWAGDDLHAGNVIWSGGQFDGDFWSHAIFTLMPSANTTLLDGANFYNHGTFQGSGTVVATNAYFRNYGFVSPGSNSPGTLTVVGNFIQQSSGSLRLGISGRQTNQFDQLSVVGPFTKAGNLVVLLEDGFVPSLGDTFKVINATSSTGSFSSNYFSPLPTGLFWRTDRLSAFGEVSVSSVPSSNVVWRSTYFTASELTNSNISGLTADPDNDGIRNVFEYLLGLNPRFAESNQNTVVFPSPVLTLNGTNNRLALRFAIPEPAPADAFYQIQVNDLAASSGWTTIASKTGLLNWTGAATVNIGNAASGRVQVTVQDTQNAATSAKRFIRLQGTVLP